MAHQTEITSVPAMSYGIDDEKKASVSTNVASSRLFMLTSEQVVVRVASVDEEKGDADSVDAVFRSAVAHQHVHRKVGSLQTQLASMGGAVGAALFIGIGGGLAIAGPACLLVGFIFWCFILWCTAECQVETVTKYPLDASFIRLAGRIVDPALGVAAGWNFFLQQAFNVCYEATAVTSLINLWSVFVKSCFIRTVG